MYPRSEFGFRRSTLPPLRGQTGFSLLELIIVVVMIGLLFSIAAVSVGRSVTGAEIRNAHRAVTAGLRHTRGQAIVQREQQVFLVDADANSWQASGEAPVRLPEGMAITLNTARSELTGENAGGIRFFPDGSSTGGSVVLSSGEREWHVSVGWLTGEIGLDTDPQS
jgi:general secretion pathway protein H